VALVAIDSFVDRASSQLISILELEACWFESFPFDTQMPLIESDRIVLPAAEPGLAPWRFGGGVELPVRFGKLTLGRFVLVPRRPTSGVAISRSDRATAIALADHVAPVIAAALLDPGSRSRTAPRSIRNREDPKVPR
jgi:hypothetical protein